MQVSRYHLRSSRANDDHTIPRAIGEFNSKNRDYSIVIPCEPFQLQALLAAVPYSYHALQGHRFAVRNPRNPGVALTFVAVPYWYQRFPYLITGVEEVLGYPHQHIHAARVFLDRGKTKVHFLRADFDLENQEVLYNL